MAARLGSLWLACLLMSGCLPLKHETLPTVGPEQAGPGMLAQAAGQKAPPATVEEQLRVDIVGRELLDANRQTGLRLVFSTIGAPTPEVFHRGTDVIFITDNLSRRCKTKGQLAAVLAYELGRTVAERESLAGPGARRPEIEPPPEVRIGSDSGGTFGPADLTRQAELAKFQKTYGKPGGVAPPPPDAMVLARAYLEKAGYQAKDLEDVSPLLREAREHDDFERQLCTGPAKR